MSFIYDHPLINDDTRREMRFRGSVFEIGPRLTGKFPVAGRVIPTPFNQPEFDYCKDCAFFCGGVCDGKKWLPFRKEPGCEFFRDKNLTCRYAIPFIQYGNNLRNNQCKLPPQERKTDARNGWEWCCPDAHRSDYMGCYKPILSPEEIVDGSKGKTK